MATPLDMFDELPREMRIYLRNNGFHFNKRSVESAVKGMRKINQATGKMERIEFVPKEQIEELLQKYNIKIENNVGYDFVYYFHQAKADLYKSSLADEKALCQYVADMINDPDLKGGNAFRHYLVDLDAKGEGADWEDWL